jgi:hypothetical protein
MYIPGETRDNDKTRKMLIENGGILALITIQEHALEPDIREEPKEFLNNLDL